MEWWQDDLDRLMGEVENSAPTWPNGEVVTGTCAPLAS